MHLHSAKNMIKAGIRGSRLTAVNVRLGSAAHSWQIVEETVFTLPEHGTIPRTMESSVAARNAKDYRVTSKPRAYYVLLQFAR